MESNPVLDPWTDNIYGAPPFQSITPAHILPALRIGIHDAIAGINAICSNLKGEPTFDNTVVPYETDSSIEKLRQLRSFFTHIVNAVQEFVSEKAPGHVLLQEFDQHPCQRSILALLTRVKKHGLSPEQAQLVRVVIEGFKSRGTALNDDAESETISLLKTELVSLRTAYSQAIKAAAPCEFVLHSPSNPVAELLSEYAVLETTAPTAHHEATTSHSIRYSVPIYTDVVDSVLSLCSDRSARESIWKSFRNRGKPANYATAQHMLVARAKFAGAMGFQNHAQFKMRDSMVSDPEEVVALYGSLLEPAKRAFEQELGQMLQISAADGISTAQDFMHWDYKYYSEKLRKDDASLVSFGEMPAFKLSEVMNGLMWLTRELYGAAMQPAPEAPTYHEHVLRYSLRSCTGALLGLMCIDVWARPGKAPGNFTHQIVRPCSSSGGRPVVSLNCSFRRLYADEEGLNFDHVKLLLHEFGHCLHCLFSDVKYASLSGTTTPDDHVELPSVLHEKFLHDPKFLSQITKATLPIGVCSKLIANDCKSIGYMLLRNVSSSILDLRLHMLPLHELQKEDFSVEDFERKLHADLGMPPQIPYLYESSAFEHIFRFDYRYYMYVWSSVLVSSALSVFMRESPRELAADVHGKGTDLHGCTCASSPDYGDTPTARLELSHGEAMSTAATHGEPNAAGDELKVAAEKGLASCAKVSTCQQQQLGAVGDGGTVLADGRSLVNAAAGASFVKHVLSKGNSESVWQGFLNFIGGHFDSSDFLRQRGLDCSVTGFVMKPK